MVSSIVALAALAALAGCLEHGVRASAHATTRDVRRTRSDAPTAGHAPVTHATAPAAAFTSDETALAAACRPEGGAPPDTVMDACEPASAQAEPFVYADDLWVNTSSLVHAGTAVCRLGTIARRSGATVLHLGGCATVAGDALRDQVALAIHGTAVRMPGHLVAGTPVRLRAVEHISDGDGPSRHWYVLRSERTGGLLLSWSEGNPQLVPDEDTLAALSLTSDEWLAPLSLRLATGLCAPRPGRCEDGNTVERAAVEIALPDSGFARILDNTTGTVGHAYRVHTGPVLLYAQPEGCVDDQARANVLIVALRACAPRSSASPVRR